MTPEDRPKDPAGIVLGQKYAYATASLLVGISCFIQLLSLERAILAVVFACLALKSQPAPRLSDRRTWAKAGLAMGVAAFIVLPVALILCYHFGGLRDIIAALEKLQ